MDSAAPTWAVLVLTACLAVGGYCLSNYLRTRHPRLYPWTFGVALILFAVLVYYT